MNGVMLSRNHDRQKVVDLLTIEAIDKGNPPFLYLTINGKALLCFLGYLILGVAFYCYSNAQISALDAIYLSVITFTTVGYGNGLRVISHFKDNVGFHEGDVSIPSKDRAFTAFFVLLGAGIVGALFGIFSGDVMEYHVS